MMKITIDIVKKLIEKLNLNTDVDILTIRGCELVENNYCVWSDELDIVEKEVDYQHMNCLFIAICNNKIMAFKGSSVPNKKYIAKALKEDGHGTNQLEYGFYKHYAKGMHRPSIKTAHRALRQTRSQPVKRTSDDFDFDMKDRIEVGNVHDNIHAAWSKINSTTMASAGCQVISGYPKCMKRNSNEGHWKKFENWIYGLEKQQFNYLLISFDWIEKTINGTMDELIIFGSKGQRVKDVQSMLRINIDGDYGPQTYKAIVSYQLKHNLPLNGVISINKVK